MLLPCKQRSSEWFEARRGKITASVVAAILGCDPHMGQLGTFNAITGRTVKKDNPYMAWGRKSEAEARAAYEVHSGNFVAETGFWLHDDLPWLGASPDGLIGADGLCEIKCPSVIPTAIPAHHDLQMLVQMACTNRDWVDYFAWSQEGEFYRRVLRDSDREREVLFLLEDFYMQYVAKDVAPPRRRPTNGADRLVEPGVTS
jgi:putative phage-type endonuclease